MEVKNAAKPIVADLAKKNILSLSKVIVPQVFSHTMSDLALLKSVPKEPGISKALQFDDSISIEAASNKPYDMFNEESVLRQNIRRSNPVEKMASKEKARRLSNLAEPRVSRKSVQSTTATTKQMENIRTNIPISSFF